MSELSMLDMNSLNAIAGLLRHMGCNGAADTLYSIQCKATRMLDENNKSQEVSNMFCFSKTVRVTNMRNVLCQIPRTVVTDWGLKEGDELELTYDEKEKEVVIRPVVHRRGDITR